MNAKDTFANGSIHFFEYHCWESHKSSDAQLWYRSHRKVKILNCVNYEEDLHKDTTSIERSDGCICLVYRVKFLDDGFEGDAWEDEILSSEIYYCRPNPPLPT